MHTWRNRRRTPSTRHRARRWAQARATGNSGSGPRKRSWRFDPPGDFLHYGKKLVDIIDHEVGPCLFQRAFGTGQSFASLLGLERGEAFLIKPHAVARGG